MDAKLSFNTVYEKPSAVKIVSAKTCVAVAAVIIQINRSETITIEAFFIRIQPLYDAGDS